jgi:type IV pilus assembly protein PilN
MKSFNLLPWREELHYAHKKKLLWQVLITVVGTVIVLLACQYRINQEIKQYHQNNIIPLSERDKFLMQLESLKKIKEELATIQIQHRSVFQLQNDQIRIIKLFNLLASSVPADMYLISMKRNSNHIFLQGEARATQVVYEFMNQSNRDQFFSNVLLKEIKNKTVANGFKQEFQLELMMN